MLSLQPMLALVFPSVSLADTIDDLLASSQTAFRLFTVIEEFTMSNTPVIHVDDAELAERMVESAARGTPLRVEVDGSMFVIRVEREKLPVRSVPSPDYDPEKVAEVLDKYVGAWAHLDVDRMIADLYKAREEGSRPADRP